MNTESENRWWRPGMFQWTWLELLIMRLGYAALGFWNIKWETRPYTKQEHPNGLAHFFDFTWLAHPPPGMAVKSMVIGFLGLYVIGFLPALGLLPLAFYATAIGTLLNSQGAINHSWQLVTLIGLAQLAVYAWPRAGRGIGVLVRPDQERHRGAAHAALVTIAACYVVCGVVKIVNSDGLWLHKAPFLAVQLYKTHYSHYYDTLQMPPEWLQRLAEILVQYPWLARILFGSGLFIELAAFVMLINRGWAFAVGLAIIALHMSISKLMNLNFDAHIFAVLIFLINIPGIPQMWRSRR